MSADGVAGCGRRLRTGLAKAVLSEVARLLERLSDAGETGAVDLHGLPMTDGDRAELEKRLGRGEIEATVSVAGVSRVWETRYAGVWWVRHFGSDERIAAEEIAVTHVPQILVAHPADIRTAASALRDDLVTQPPQGASEESRHVGP